MVGFVGFFAEGFISFYYFPHFQAIIKAVRWFFNCEGFSFLSDVVRVFFLCLSAKEVTRQEMHRVRQNGLPYFRG